MIKECKVVSYNKFLHILVFDFGGKLIQTTCEIQDNTKKVYVKFDNGTYTIVSKQEYEKSLRPEPKPVEAYKEKIRNEHK